MKICKQKDFCFLFSSSGWFGTGIYREKNPKSSLHMSILPKQD